MEPDSSLFTVFFYGVGLFIAVIFIVIVVALIRGARAAAARRSAPHQSASALVVATRSQITGGGETRVWTTHYATFQTADGNRFELVLPQHLAGMIVQGDRGLVHWHADVLDDFQREGTAQAR